MLAGRCQKFKNPRGHRFQLQRRLRPALEAVTHGGSQNFWFRPASNCNNFQTAGQTRAGLRDCVQRTTGPRTAIQKTICTGRPPGAMYRMRAFRGPDGAVSNLVGPGTHGVITGSCSIDASGLPRQPPARVKAVTFEPTERTEMPSQCTRGKKTQLERSSNK